MRKFLWGGVEGECRVAWVRWEQVCRSKEDGGLGIKDLERFNLALLGKWRWRLSCDHQSLWCRVLRAKYGEGT